MRKIILSILILLLAAQAWGQQGAVLSGAVVVGAGVSAAAAACTNTTIIQSEVALDNYAYINGAGVSFASEIVSVGTGVICKVGINMSTHGTLTDGALNVYIYAGDTDGPTTLKSTCTSIPYSTFAGAEQWYTVTGCSASVTTSEIFWLVVKGTWTNSETNRVSHMRDYACTTEHIKSGTVGNWSSTYSSTDCLTHRIYYTD